MKAINLILKQPQLSFRLPQQVLMSAGIAVTIPKVRVLRKLKTGLREMMEILEEGKAQFGPSFYEAQIEGALHYNCHRILNELGAEPNAIALKALYDFQHTVIGDWELESLPPTPACKVVPLNSLRGHA